MKRSLYRSMISGETVDGLGYIFLMDNSVSSVIKAIRKAFTHLMEESFLFLVSSIYCL